MNYAKKLLALILALTLALALGTGALADTITQTTNTTTNVTNTTTTASASENYTITITQHESDTASHTYGAYQIFAGDLLIEQTTDGTTTSVTSKTLSNLTWGTGVDKSKLGDLAAALNAIDGISGLTADSTVTAFAEAMASVGTTAGDSAREQAVAAALASVLTNTTSGTFNSENKTITGLAAGYYLVQDIAAPSGDEGAYTRFILEVVADVDVTEKASVPTVDKSVADINDSTETAETVEVDDNNNPTETADYDIGDDVPFTLTATTASTVSDYTKYHVTFVDTMDDALLSNGEYTVSYDGTEIGTLTANNPTATNTTAVSGVTITAKLYDDDELKAENLEGATFAIRVSFAYTDTTNTAKLPAALNSQTVTVDFTAELTEDAVIGNDGQSNEVYLKYSNNPNSTDDSEEGTTPEDIVTVFTYELNVNKVDGSNRPLDGAAFTLYKLIATEENGTTTYAWGEGSVLNPTAVTADDGETILSYTATWSGLDDGVYRLSETTTPAGYNTADDVTFAVVAVHGESADGTERKITSLEIHAATVTEANGAVTGYSISNTVLSDESATASFTADADSGVIDTTVVNNQGVTLPRTGGVGTTIFYIVGAVLVIGAGVVLVAKKRMGSAE